MANWIAPAYAQAAADRPIRIVALGDSLTAGFGLPPAAALPEQLQKLLTARGHLVAIENAGVSGDTASGGLDRLNWSVSEGTDAVILGLGANDALRGIDPSLTARALEAIVRKLAERKIEVMLAGMLAPRNLGPDYGRAFDAIYPDLARRYDLVFYPFLLDGVAATPSLNLGDGIHPNAAGVAAIAERMVPRVEELIARVKRRRGA